MVSAPPRELLPALLLIVGLFFCTITVTGVTNPSGIHTYSETPAGDSCSNSSTATYEFDELSPRGQAFFLETLESESSEVDIYREEPPEFSDGAATDGTGKQYISKDDHCYELTIQGPGGFGGFGASIKSLLQFIAGTGLVLAGSLSYVRSYSLLPGVLLGGSAVFVISPLLWLVGLFRWSMRMQELPQPQIAVAITGLLSISAILYIRYASQ
jgi:hypothetical protein